MICEEHRVWCEKINETPATTAEGLRVKYDAIGFALLHDPDALFDGPGSAFNLAQSFCYDIKAKCVANERELANHAAFLKERAAQRPRG